MVDAHRHVALGRAVAMQAAEPEDAALGADVLGVKLKDGVGADADEGGVDVGDAVVDERRGHRVCKRRWRGEATRKHGAG